MYPIYSIYRRYRKLVLSSHNLRWQKFCGDDEASKRMRVLLFGFTLTAWGSLLTPWDIKEFGLPYADFVVDDDKLQIPRTDSTQDTVEECFVIFFSFHKNCEQLSVIIYHLMDYPSWISCSSFKTSSVLLFGPECTVEEKPWFKNSSGPIVTAR